MAMWILVLSCTTLVWCAARRRPPVTPAHSSFLEQSVAGKYIKETEADKGYPNKVKMEKRFATIANATTESSNMEHGARNLHEEALAVLQGNNKTLTNLIDSTTETLNKTQIISDENKEEIGENENILSRNSSKISDSLKSLSNDINDLSQLVNSNSPKTTNLFTSVYNFAKDRLDSASSSVNAVWDGLKKSVISSSIDQNFKSGNDQIDASKQEGIKNFDEAQQGVKKDLESFGKKIADSSNNLLKSAGAEEQRASNLLTSLRSLYSAQKGQIAQLESNDSQTASTNSLNFTKFKSDTQFSIDNSGKNIDKFGRDLRGDVVNLRNDFNSQLTAESHKFSNSQSVDVNSMAVAKRESESALNQSSFRLEKEVKEGQKMALGKLLKISTENFQQFTKNNDEYVDISETIGKSLKLIEETLSLSSDKMTQDQVSLLNELVNSINEFQTKIQSMQTTNVQSHANAIATLRALQDKIKSLVAGVDDSQISQAESLLSSLKTNAQGLDLKVNEQAPIPNQLFNIGFQSKLSVLLKQTDEISGRVNTTIHSSFESINDKFKTSSDFIISRMLKSIGYDQEELKAQFEKISDTINKSVSKATSVAKSQAQQRLDDISMTINQNTQDNAHIARSVSSGMNDVKDSLSLLREESKNSMELLQNSRKIFPSDNLTREISGSVADQQLLLQKEGMAAELSQNKSRETGLSEVAKIAKDSQIDRSSLDNSVNALVVDKDRVIAIATKLSQSKNLTQSQLTQMAIGADGKINITAAAAILLFSKQVEDEGAARQLIQMVTKLLGVKKTSALLSKNLLFKNSDRVLATVNELKNLEIHKMDEVKSDLDRVDRQSLANFSQIKSSEERATKRVNDLYDSIKTSVANLPNLLKDPKALFTNNAVRIRKLSGVISSNYQRLKSLFASLESDFKNTSSKRVVDDLKSLEEESNYLLDQKRTQDTVLKSTARYMEQLKTNVTTISGSDSLTHSASIVGSKSRNTIANYKDNIDKLHTDDDQQIRDLLMSSRNKVVEMENTKSSMTIEHQRQISDLEQSVRKSSDQHSIELAEENRKISSNINSTVDALRGTVAGLDDPRYLETFTSEDQLLKSLNDARTSRPQQMTDNILSKIKDVKGSMKGQNRINLAARKRMEYRENREILHGASLLNSLVNLTGNTMETIENSPAFADFVQSVRMIRLAEGRIESMVKGEIDDLFTLVNPLNGGLYFEGILKDIATEVAQDTREIIGNCDYSEKLLTEVSTGFTMKIKGDSLKFMNNTFGKIDKNNFDARSFARGVGEAVSGQTRAVVSSVSSMMSVFNDAITQSEDGLKNQSVSIEERLRRLSQELGDAYGKLARVSSKQNRLIMIMRKLEFALKA